MSVTPDQTKAPPVPIDPDAHRRVDNAPRYTRVVLGRFRDKNAERIWRRQRSHRLDSVTQRAALRKLLVMDAAEELDDLRPESVGKPAGDVRKGVGRLVLRGEQAQ